MATREMFRLNICPKNNMPGDKGTIEIDAQSNGINSVNTLVNSKTFHLWTDIFMV